MRAADTAALSRERRYVMITLMLIGLLGGLVTAVSPRVESREADRRATWVTASLTWSRARPSWAR